jgi:hypothetical protein
MFRVFVKVFDFLRTERPGDFRRNAQRQMLLREPEAGRHHGSRSHHGLFLDFRAVQKDGAHADQAVVRHAASVQYGAVADGNIPAENGGQAVIGMKNRVVLYIGALTENDLLHVTPQDNIGPDRDFRSEPDAADHLRRLVHESGRMNFRPDPVEFSNRHGSLQQMQQDGFLGVQAVFRLVEHDRPVTVHDGVGDLLAAVRGQAMHHDGVFRRFLQKLIVDLIG